MATGTKTDPGTDFQAQIDALQAQIAALTQGQTSTGTASSTGQGNDGGNYVVLTTAITVRVGPRPNDVRRYVRGNRFTPSKFIPQDKLDRLKAIKAIAADDGEPKRATTAQILARASGAPGDPAASPIVDVLSVPLPTTEEAKAQQAQADADAAAEEEQANQAAAPAAQPVPEDEQSQVYPSASQPSE